MSGRCRWSPRPPEILDRILHLSSTFDDALANWSVGAGGSGNDTHQSTRTPCDDHRRLHCGAGEARCRGALLTSCDRRDGSSSARIHLGQYSSKRVTNYAQWRSRADLEAWCDLPRLEVRELVVDQA
jgi:hypothetical protein